MNKIILWAVVIIVVVGGAWLIVGNKGGAPASETISPSGDTSSEINPSEPPAMGGTDAGMNVDMGTGANTSTTKEFTVTGQNFSFSPSTLTVNKGDTVKITFKNG